MTVADNPKIKKNRSRLEIVAEMITPVESSLKYVSSTTIILLESVVVVTVVAFATVSSER